MYIHTYDANRIIHFGLHVGDALSEAELREILDLVDTIATTLSGRKDAFATTIVIVDTPNPPNAAQRKRLGEAAKKLDRGVQVLITKSTLARAVMTAIRWFSPPSDVFRHGTFGTYEEARTWLVKETKHPAEVFDVMHAELRQKVARVR